MKKHVLPLLLIAVVVLWQTASLLRPGWFASHDGIFHIRRAAEMTEMLKAGYFPVRWGLSLDNYYGTPLFNYVYPLPYYLAAGLTLATPLGTPTALKIISVGAFALGGLAWYLLFQRQSKLWGLGAAFLYLTTPYQLVNLFVRFSLGEMLALAFLPFVLLAHQQLARLGRLTWYSPLPLFFALTSHNFLGLLGMAVILIHAFLTLPHFKLILKNTFISLLLASFFLLPMWGERALVLSGAVHDFSFRYSDHFVTLKQLLYSRWDYWYSMPGVALDGMTFQLGFGVIATFGLFLLTGFQRAQKRTSLVLLVLFGLTILLMLSASSLIWELVPSLQAIQFPWRLIGLTTFLAPLLLWQVRAGLPRSPWAAWLVVIMILALGVINTRNYRLPRKFWSSEEFATEYALIKDKTATSLRNELVPAASTQERWQSVLVTAPSETELKIDPESTQGLIIFTARGNGDGGGATVHKNYFPSWQGRVDEDKLTLAPSIDGAIAVPLSSGTHTYTVRLGSTPLEVTGNVLSLLGLLALLGIARGYVR